jgi:hypothetical protein
VADRDLDHELPPDPGEDDLPDEFLEQDAIPFFHEMPLSQIEPPDLREYARELEATLNPKVEGSKPSRPIQETPGNRGILLERATPKCGSEANAGELTLASSREKPEPVRADTSEKVSRRRTPPNPKVSG